MHDYPTAQPPQTYLRKPIAEADGLVITAFILAWIVPPIGLIMAVVSRNQAKRAGMIPSALSTWALVLGILWTLATVFWIILFVVSFASAVSQTGG